MSLLAVARDARPGDLLALALWSGMVFGSLEGLVIAATRGYPTIWAPTKVSADVLWVAPVVDSLVLLALAVVGLALARWAGVALSPGYLGWACRAALFIGVLTVSSALPLLHPLASALLAIGVTSVASPLFRGRENALTTWLARRWALPALLIVAVAVGVTAVDWVREVVRVRRLPVAAGRPANVLIVVLDTIRFDRLTGEARARLAPNLDRLAARGVSFVDAWSTTSWSLPSQASILAGGHPQEHGADWPGFGLDPGRPTLAEYLGGQGYVTGAFSGNASWIVPEHLGRGFHRFEVYQLEDLLRRTVQGRVIDWFLTRLGVNPAGRTRRATEVNRGFLRFVDRHAGRPFFAYLCYMDVNRAFFHRRWNRPPWRARVPLREEIDAYDAGLRALDAEIGALLSGLEQRGRLDRTLVIVTSDHGESFGTQADDHDPEGHGTSLYAEQLRVPLIVVGGQGKTPVDGVSREPASVADIPATVLTELGLEPAPFGSRGLPLAWRGAPARPSASRDRCVLASLRYEGRHVDSAIRHGLQYIRDSRHSPPREELYDLVADPAGRHNLALADARIDALRACLDEGLAFGADGRGPSGR